MTNPNEPAMPVISGNVVHSIGLTKREYMATKIMAGMVANPSDESSYEWIAENAVKVTDELIKALNKDEES